MSALGIASSPLVKKQSVLALLDQALAIRVNDLPKSIALGKEALEQSHFLNDKELIAQSLSKLSLFYMITGQNDLSLKSAEEAIDYFKESGNDKGIADAKYSIAGTLYKTDQFYLGLVHLGECLTIYQKHEDYFNLSRVYKSMGTIYEYFGDVNGAVKVYESAIDSGKKINDSNLISNAYNPLSGIYLNEGRLDEAMVLINEAIEMKQGTGDIRGLAFSLYGRGKVFLKTEKYAEAEADFTEALAIHEQMNESLGKAMTLRKLGVLHFMKKEYAISKEMAIKTLDLAKECNIGIARVDAYHLLYNISREEGLIAESLHFLEQYLFEKDHIVNERSSKMIQSFEVVSRIQSLELEAQAQRERNQIIEKKNQELDSFFLRVSHDLKGPISSLIGIDAMLRRELKDETISNFLDLSITQVHRINKILDELIMLTRVTHGEARKQVIDFGKMIDEIVTSLDGLEHFSSVRIERKIEKNLNFSAAWALINTILQNLIENGIKYSRLDQRNPFVKIAIRIEKGLLRIHVADNGIGMTKETGDQIFEMFYRANRQTSGSGLGLYILNRAVEKLNGTVDVQSEPNKGSSFTVMLPMS